MPKNICTNTYGVSKFVVSPDATQGNFATIQAAINAATAGDTIFVRDGVYNESVVFKSGIAVTALLGDADVPNVTIVGACSYAAASGNCSIDNIAFQTNGTYAMSIAATGAGNLYFNNCRFLATNFTAFNFASTNASFWVWYFRCEGDLTSATAAYLNKTGIERILIYECNFFNTIASDTANTMSAGTIVIRRTQFQSRCIVSGTANFSTGDGGIMNPPGPSESLIISTNTNNTIANSSVANGSTVATTAVVRVDSPGALILNNASILSNFATDPIQGTGTVENWGCNITNGFGPVSVTTLNKWPVLSGKISFDGGANYLANYTEGTYTPVLSFGGASVGIVYATQRGNYTRIGRIVNFTMSISLTSKGTSVGNVAITLPPINALVANAVTTAGGLSVTFTGYLIGSVNATTTIQINDQTPAGGSNSLTNTNFANNSIIFAAGFYFAS